VFLHPSRNRILLFGFFLLTIVFGLIYSYVDPNSILPQKDALDYDQIGWNLTQGNGFSLDNSGPTLLRGPVFPVLLAIIYHVAGHNYPAVRFVQIILNAINCLLVFLVCRELVDEKTGLVASFFYAIYPAFTFYTGLILTETLTITLLLTSMFFLFKAIRYKNYTLTVLSGVVLGLSTLCKPTTLLYAPFLGLVMLTWKTTRKFFKHGLVLAIVVLFIILPWTFRNYRVSGHFVPVSVFSGYNLFLGTFPRNASSLDITEFKNAYYTNPVEKDTEALIQGWQNIKTNPAQFISIVPSKLVYFWLPDGLAVVGNSRTLPGMTLILFQLALLLFAVVGWYSIKASPQSVGLTSLIIYFTLVHVIIISTPRFNLPVMPFILIFSSIGLLKLLSYAHSSQLRSGHR
jgi:4-amino-4-deoxy-L-arabinose transferase-like glycosyltransferase